MNPTDSAHRPSLRDSSDGSLPRPRHRVQNSSMDASTTETSIPAEVTLERIRNHARTLPDVDMAELVAEVEADRR